MLHDEPSPVRRLSALIGQPLKIARIESSANVISGCGTTPITSVAAVENQSGQDRLGAMTIGVSSFGGIKNM